MYDYITGTNIAQCIAYERNKWKATADSYAADTVKETWTLATHVTECRKIRTCAKISIDST